MRGEIVDIRIWTIDAIFVEMDNGDSGESDNEGDVTKPLGQNSLKALQADFNSVLFDVSCLKFLVWDVLLSS